jgi:hypothetical protein
MGRKHVIEIKKLTTVIVSHLPHVLTVTCLWSSVRSWEWSLLLSTSWTRAEAFDSNPSRSWRIAFYVTDTSSSGNPYCVYWVNVATRTTSQFIVYKKTPRDFKSSQLKKHVTHPFPSLSSAIPLSGRSPRDTFQTC